MTHPSSIPPNGPHPPARQREQRLAAVLSALFLLIVLSPIVENWREDPYDGFPLSYYPMFSHARDDDQRVVYLAAVDTEGHREGLDYRLAGTGGFNQVRRQIRRTVRDGRAEALCARVADEIVRRDRTSQAGLVEVVVLTGTYSLDAYFSGNKAPLAEEIHATCPIDRNPS